MLLAGKLGLMGQFNCGSGSGAAVGGWGDIVSVPVPVLEAAANERT